MNALSGEETLFNEAVRLPPEERATFLENATKDNDALRHRVQTLLKGFEAAGFLERAASGLRSNTAGSVFPREKPGDKIGRYKLLQQIGEGGCGVVYMAEQEEPVRRRVALKIIKLGMDTKSVIARFEAERQALALMDHPNIAKVLDAGATETGRPYFVMELVRGVKITEYCDEKKLSTRERLALFVCVCQAVQHAHQKGVIHRDIKPSNILVTVNDGVAVPKVIDFGIAKATGGQQLTDKTLFTAFEQFIGTPAYMSPEQAVMTSLDVDTRSDIYALGVLLYELLTGKTPFDAAELLAIGLDEMRRTIREKEPERPSTRLSTLPGAELSTTAQRRGLDPPKLVTELRGDLDWIVMKALEKDRARRYETANGLAMDVQRHLMNEPVVARPPSGSYRFQKWVRRNKVTFTAAAAVVSALVVGLGAATWLYIQERAAKREQVRLLRQAQVNEASALFHLGEFEFLWGDRPAEAETAFRKSLEIRRNILGDLDPDTLSSWFQLVRQLWWEGKTNEMEQLVRELNVRMTQLEASHAEATAKGRQALGDSLARQGRWDEAINDFRIAIRLDPTDRMNYHDLAPILVTVGDLPGYKQLCADLANRFGGTTDPVIADTVAKNCLLIPNSGVELAVVSDFAETAVTVGRLRHMTRASPWFEFCRGLADYRMGDFAAAEQWMRKVLDQSGGYAERAIEAAMILAMAQHQLGRADEAQATFTKGADLANRKRPAMEYYVGNWQDRLIGQLLIKEARALLASEKEPRLGDVK